MWCHDHFALLYWNYNTITEGNFKYMTNLSSSKKLDLCQRKIYCTHDVQDIFNLNVFDTLKSANHNKIRSLCDYSKISFNTYVTNLLANDSEFNRELTKWHEDIILVGHSHVQWHAFLGNKLILNPGSIGIPLDKKDGATYSIISLETASVEIEERLVNYDKRKTIEELRKSNFYEQAAFMCEMASRQLVSGEDEITFFFRHVAEIKKKHNQTASWPVSNEVFREACLTWL